MGGQATSNDEAPQAGRPKARKRAIFTVLATLLSLVLLELLTRGAVAAKRRLIDPRNLLCADPNFSLCPLHPFWIEENSIVYYDPLVGVRYQPGFQGEYITINSHGFRGPEFDIEKPPGTVRVVLVGSSALFGAANHDDGIITYFLQQELDSRFGPGRVEVINAGIAGANSAQELAVIQFHALEWDPDIVVVYSGHNDAAFSIIPGWSPHYTGTLPALTHRSFEYSIPTIGEGIRIFASSLVNRSETYRVARQIVSSLTHTRAGAPRSADLHPDPDALRAYRDNLTRMALVLNEKDVPMVYIFQPVLGLGEHPMTDLERQLYEEGLEVYELIYEIYPDYIETMYEVADEYGFEAYDFVSALDDETEMVFQSPMHLYPAGNRIVAEEIADILEDRVEGMLADAQTD